MLSAQSTQRGTLSNRPDSRRKRNDASLLSKNRFWSSSREDKYCGWYLLTNLLIHSIFHLQGVQCKRVYLRVYTCSAASEGHSSSGANTFIARHFSSSCKHVCPWRHLCLALRANTFIAWVKHICYTTLHLSGTVHTEFAHTSHCTHKIWHILTNSSSLMLRARRLCLFLHTRPE